MGVNLLKTKMIFTLLIPIYQKENTIIKNSQIGGKLISKKELVLQINTNLKVSGIDEQNNLERVKKDLLLLIHTKRFCMKLINLLGILYTALKKNGKKSYYVSIAVNKKNMTLDY